MFEQCAREYPDRIAARYGDQVLTYYQLDLWADRIANSLRQKGVGPETIVAICADRSLGMLAGLLGILKAGGAYLPLDPTHPRDRLMAVLEDSQPAVALTQRHLSDVIFPVIHSVLFLEELSVTRTDRPLDSQPVYPLAQKEAGPENLAYVIYTSGSTGKPKGVQITHGSLANLLSILPAELEISEQDVFSAVMTLCFDFATSELLLPLTCGASVVIYSSAVAANGALLAAALERDGITMMQATPSTWRLLVEAGWKGLPRLKMVTGGEPLTARLCSELLTRGAALWNGYGPTETTIWATARRMTPADSRITIGHPLPTYTTHVLDAQLAPVSPGEPGELCIGGPNVARGYLNRPELTAEKFVPDPFSNQPGARLYRTGDLARILPDGEIDLLGRADNQVKFRGYRVELGEIEAVFERHPAVSQCVVTMRDDGTGDQRMLAYLIPAQGQTLCESELREHARRFLPAYMVPSRYVAVDSFPVTPNGKLDRRRLPDPEPVEARLAEPGEPLKDEERWLLEIWRSILGRSDIGLDDNFFDAGGHSLLAHRIFARIGTETGSRLPLGVILECPTVRTLAQRLRNEGELSNDGLVTLQPEGAAPPLYLIHHLHGDVVIYRSLALLLGRERPVYGLEPPADLLENSDLDSIEALAAHYVRMILAAQPEGPYHLGGYSSGGVLAFEMARQLRAMGKAAGVLAMIDTDVRAPGPAIGRSARMWKIFWRKLHKVVFKLRFEMQRGLRASIARWMECISVLSIRTGKPGSAGTKRPGTLRDMLWMLELNYRPKPYPGAAVLFRAEDEAWRLGPDPWMGWSTLIARLEMIDIPGNHVTIFGPPALQQMAREISSRMSAFDKSPAPIRAGQSR